jgi:phospholipid/cholesterol/gamma-HCH transport system substrate-binding protein
MKKVQLSASVIGFLILGAVSLIYLFMTLGEVSIRSGWEYTVYADFSNASGLTPGSAVEIAGVRVGRVTGIALNGTRSQVAISLQKDVRLQDDVIASIQTKGLLGERYILLTPGGSEEYIHPEGKIRETEAPLDIPGLMAAYIANRNKTAPQKPPTPSTP